MPLLLIWALFATTCLGAIVLAAIIFRPEKSKSHGATVDQNAPNHSRLGHLFENAKRGFKAHCSKKQNQSPADRAANRLVVATWAIAALAVATIVVGYWQYGAIKGQLDEMRGEQRPWLAAAPELAGDLIYAKGTLKENIKIAIKNVGHTPAFRVKAEARIIHHKPALIIPSANPLKDVCSESYKLSDWFYFDPDEGADILFPGESDKIDAIAFGDSAVRDLKGEEKKMAFPPGLQAPDAIYEDLSLLYCVAYGAIGDSVPHHTGGTISLVIKDTPNGGAKIVDGQPIPVNRLELERPAIDWRNYAD